MHYKNLIKMQEKPKIYLKQQTYELKDKNIYTMQNRNLKIEFVHTCDII